MDSFANENQSKQLEDFADLMEQIPIDGTDFSIYRSFGGMQVPNEPRFGRIALTMDRSQPFLWDLHQQQYDQVGNFATQVIQTQMVQQYGLKEVLVPPPKNAPKNIEKCNIFMSKEFYAPDVQKNAKSTAVVLIKGTGDVRAGCWSRQVMIKNDFDIGTMLPQIDWAVNEKNYPVLIMNPIQAHGTHEAHCMQVWNKFVKDAGFKNLLLVVHSAGGKSFKQILTTNSRSFMKTVQQVALTDVGVDIDSKTISKEVNAFLQKKVIHYKRSEQGLGTKLATKKSWPITNLSAGHPNHHFTTGVSWPLIQALFEGNA